jgi:AcrR family transcriptional regulator
VGRHASACNSAAFKAWEDLEILRHSSDNGIDSGFGACADAPPPRASYDRLVEIEIASVWNQERMARERNRLYPKSSPDSLDSSASVAFRDKIHQYAKRKGASNPSAQTHFLLAVLDHREGREIQALARLRRIPARDSSTVWKAAVAMLYGQILSERSPDSAMALLRSALPDSSLTAPARFLLGRIELTKGNLPQALEQFSDYLDLPPAPSPGSRLQAVGLAAHILSEQIRSSRRGSPTVTVRDVLHDSLPRSARDTIALQVARNLAASDDTRDCIEILSSFQIDHPGTKLGDEARSLLSRVRRNRTGIVAH